jgi:hypothetical protein
MSKPHQPHATDSPSPLGMQEFERAVRGLSQVPKKEVDDAIAKEKADKKKRKAK